MAAAWAGVFGWLAVVRDLAGGSAAEDLGFTDQVISNFLRGQWYRMSIYQGATWNTEIDISRVARPDSLLAFHVEPMLLLFVPLYAVGGGTVALLIVQATGVALGAVPAYRLGHRAAGSLSPARVQDLAGVAVAAAYLLSPLGQWATLSDFHTSTLAAPLLVLAVERLYVARAPDQALAAAVLAASAREDVGPVLAALGLVVVLHDRPSRAGWAMLCGGVAWTILAALVIRMYSGDVSPFAVRYGATVGSGFSAALSALLRPSVLGYAKTLVLSGGWLALFAPLALVPALPSLALNALSTSPWMASGKAHYSGLVLPFIVVGAAAGLRQLSQQPGLVRLASAGLLVGSAVGYVLDGAGPLGGDYAPASMTDHAIHAAVLANSLPRDAAVSASSALVPRVSRRPHVYVFPAILDADYVFVDLEASPAPTSAGDVFMRIQSLLQNGGWSVQAAQDGLLLLQRDDNAPPTDMTDLASKLGFVANAPPEPAADAVASPAVASPAVGSPAVASPAVGSPAVGGPAVGGPAVGGPAVDLVSAALVPSPVGAIDVDGPRWILRTVWRAAQPLPSGTHLDLWVTLHDGEQIHAWDLAPTWWNPPDRWPPGESVTVDVPDLPVREFATWQATFSGGQS